mmetsp:Transcript_1287/g.1915  ORF Transcript_1287/g.1915 Transcript_1287/m.1915 type:complete len:115 (-) Transcript_1287:123-467(-)
MKVWVVISIGIREHHTEKEMAAASSVGYHLVVVLCVSILRCSSSSSVDPVDHKNVLWPVPLSQRFGERPCARHAHQRVAAGSSLSSYPPSTKSPEPRRSSTATAHYPDHGKKRL